MVESKDKNMPVLNWIGKDKVVNHDKELPFRVLKPVKELSVGEKSENLIIQGDNLEGLKALMPFYYNKVNCIYIDPPYNTGFENWVYNDKVNSPAIKAWLNKVVAIDDLARHEKWLCMMYPRLKLLKDLLADNGLICISIDDNELHNLRLLMNEIFGENNFKNIIIIKRGAKSVQAQFDKIDKLGVGAEYILVYSKSPDFRLDQFYIGLEDSRQGAWNNHWRGTDRPTMRYELFGITPESGQWRWSKQRSLRAMENYRKLLKEVGKNEENITQQEIDAWYVTKLEDGEDLDLLRLSVHNKPEHYIPLSDYKLGNSLWTDIISGGSAELRKIFGAKVFDNPKPVELVKRIVQMTSNDKNAIILDSFAGSGTTGQAVLELNKEDEGNRKFILVELEADIAKNVIAKRLKKVIEGYNGAKFPSGTGQGVQYLDLNGELYDSTGLVNSNTKYEDMAAYIYFTETKNYLDISSIKNPYIGTQGSTSYFLFFEGKGNNILDEKTLKKTDEHKGNRVIYADKTLLDEEYLAKYNVVFKQIPYELKKY